ncbi:hypothetical protein BDY24DRAFT_387725 [Mrakia frigida]|uniref:uncharacterized protein n=1 Tax=Mrakia frigida TaxID=29902 RepID=UPI003FCC0255
MHSSLLLTSLLAVLTTSPAPSFSFPIESRIVGTVTCSAYNFTTPNVTGLFINETALKKIVELGLEKDKVTIGDEEVGGDQGAFGFEVCESTFMKSDNTNSSTLFGHTTYTAANGSAYCLTTTYPYKGQTPFLEECFYSDDSRQFWQWWSLLLNPDSPHFPAANSTTTPNLLEFLGPSILPSNDPLYPSDDSFTSENGNLTLEAENGDSFTYFYFDTPEEVALASILEKKVVE